MNPFSAWLTVSRIGDLGLVKGTGQEIKTDSLDKQERIIAP